MTPDYPIVYVEWVDSNQWHGWSEAWEYSEMVKDRDVLKCKTIGFMVLGSDDRVLIAGSLNSDGHGLSPLAIPRCAITKLIVVGKGVPPHRRSPREPK